MDALQVSQKREKPPNHLRAWRERSGLLQADVEHHFNWGQSRVSTLESGRGKVTDQVLNDLARLYGCRPGDLLEPPPTSPGELPTADVVRRLINHLQQLLEIIERNENDVVKERRQFGEALAAFADLNKSLSVGAFDLKERTSELDKTVEQLRRTLGGVAPARSE